MFSAKQRSNFTLSLFIVVVITMITSCSVMKKKCDCPEFGKKKRVSFHSR